MSSPSGFSVAISVNEPNREVDPTTLKLYDQEVEGNDDMFLSLMQYIKEKKSFRSFDLDDDYLTIRPVARKGYGSIAHEAKPNGLLIRGP